jgi:hypothetical protein
MDKILNIFMLLITTMLFLAGCNSSGVSIDMTGTWSATFTNNANNDAKVTFTLNLIESGSSLSGSASLSGVFVGSISGSRNGSKFTFTLPVSGVGTFNVEGTTTSLNNFSASYTASGGGYGHVNGSR